MDEPVLHPVIDRTPQHDQHDPFAIAQLAADDLRPTERARAIVLVGSCRECATLLADLRSIASATTALPSLPAGARPRDFRLSDADAARLRRGSWRRWFGFTRSPRLSFTQPLGVGLATIGLAGLLISGGAFGFAASTSAPAPEAPSGAAVQAAPSEGSDPGASGDGGEFTMRTTTDAGSSSDATGPAAGASPPAAPIAGGAPAASQQAEMVHESQPADDSTKIAAPPADAMPASGDATPGTADGDAAGRDAASDLAGRAPQTGWLILLVTGVALVLLRPVLGRLARR